MLLKCRSLHALKFAFVSKLEAMHHLALENMKNLKVKNYNLSFFLLTFDYLWRSPKTFIIRTKYRQQGNCFRVFESESFQRHLWRSFIDNITLSQPRSFFFLLVCALRASVFCRSIQIRVMTNYWILLYLGALQQRLHKLLSLLHWWAMFLAHLKDQVTPPSKVTKKLEFILLPLSCN